MHDINVVHIEPLNTSTTSSFGQGEAGSAAYNVRQYGEYEFGAAVMLLDWFYGVYLSKILLQ